MASEAQIAANRRNALRSTGPKSEEGKARVARNGLKHGLCSARVLLPGEDAAEFEALVADLAARWAPADAAELALLREYAAAMWRLDRIPALEADLLRAPEDADPGWDLGQAFLARSKEILRLSLHEGRIARQRERARKELEALQAARRAREAELALLSESPSPAPAGGEGTVAEGGVSPQPGRDPSRSDGEGEGQRSAWSRSPGSARRPDPHPGPLPQAREREQDQPLAPELALLSRKAA